MRRARRFASVAVVLLFAGSWFAAPTATADARADQCPSHATSGSSVHLDVDMVDAAGTTYAWASVGAGPPLLLLNGTGSPMAEWDPALLEALAVDRRVIVFDYPGLGLSGEAPGRMTFASMADWTARFMAAIGIDGADVLGWSMGGFIAQQLAVRHPESIGRLVLAATNPGGPSAVLGPPWVQEVDSDPDGGIDAYLATNYPATACAQAAGRAFVARLERAVRSGRYPREATPRSTYDAMVRAEDPWLRSPANARSLAGISARTLVITGGRDVVTPPPNSRVIASRVPGAVLRLVPGAGHSFLFQDPAQAAAIVRGFLASR